MKIINKVILNSILNFIPNRLSHHTLFLKWLLFVLFFPMPPVFFPEIVCPFSLLSFFLLFFSFWVYIYLNAISCYSFYIFLGYIYYTIFPVPIFMPSFLNSSHFFYFLHFSDLCAAATLDGLHRKYFTLY